MATPGELITETARLLGLPENAILTPWRVLREAGAVSKGGRGKNAVHVTPADAANLLIAVCGDAPLKSVLENWREYAHLPPYDKSWNEFPAEVPLPTLKA